MSWWDARTLRVRFPTLRVVMLALLLGTALLPATHAAGQEPPDADAIVARSIKAFYQAGNDMSGVDHSGLL